MPFVWRFFGAQAFIVAEKTAGAERPAAEKTT
jgi:hypothetical protein